MGTEESACTTSEAGSCLAFRQCWVPAARSEPIHHSGNWNDRGDRPGDDPGVLRSLVNGDEGWIKSFEIGPPPRRSPTGTVSMFFFYLNKLGWLGSILISIVLTIVLVLALRSCGPDTRPDAPRQIRIAGLAHGGEQTAPSPGLGGYAP